MSDPAPTTTLRRPGTPLVPGIPANEPGVAKGKHAFYPWRGTGTVAGRRPSRLVRGASLLLCLATVGLPTLLATVYYGLIASDQYVTEVQFGVRSPDAQRNDAGSMFQGMATASEIGLHSNVVAQYIKSRDIVEGMSARIDLRQIFARPSADFLSRLDPHTSVEGLVDFWRGKVEPYFDLTTGIVSVRVRAFTPQDAQAIGREILTLSENLVEDLSRRARVDTVKFAQEQVDEAAGRLRKTRQDLLEFRDQERLLDPVKEADAARASITKLKDELAKARTELFTARATVVEKSPKVTELQARIAALVSLIDDAGKQLTTSDRQTVPLSRNLRGFDALDTERHLAEKLYETSLQSLQRAQFEASRRMVYLEVFVRPAPAEQALYPRRTVSVLIVALTGFGAWIFLLMLFYSVREHI